MQRSINLLSGIAGSLAGFTVAYIFNPLARCEALMNSLSEIKEYPVSTSYHVATFAAGFQKDFVNYFNLNYPAHGQDFHNLLMGFNSYERVYQIGLNITNLSFATFKSTLVTTCLESVSNYQYVKAAAIGVAAGASIVLLSQKFSLFQAEPVTQRKTSAERLAILNQVRNFSHQDLQGYRAGHGYDR